MADRAPDPLAADLAGACASIARALAESLELPEVLRRITTALRLVAPVDAMGIWYAEVPDEPIRPALGPGDQRPPRPTDRPLRRVDHSPRLWPAPGERPRCIGDATRELDPSFGADRSVIDLGYRSTLVMPLGEDAREVIWLVHREPHTYTLEHARALRPVVDLATLAVEHTRLQTLTRERRHRRDALEALLPTLARALDVHAVFAQISEVTRGVLPHDYLSLGLVTPNGGIRFHVSTRGAVTQTPEYRPTTDFGRESVFAAGDVRHHSPRGVAAAVADGATASRSVFEYLHGE